MGREIADLISDYTSKVGEIVHYKVANYFAQKNATLERQDMPKFVFELSTKELDRVMKHIPIAMEYFEEFIDLYEKKIEIIDIETTVINYELQYAGRFDIKMKFNNIPTIVDVKTFKMTSGIYLEKVEKQLAGYNMAMDSWAKRAYVLRIHPYTDEFKGWSFDPIRMNREGFLNNLKEYKKRFEEKKHEKHILQQKKYYNNK